MFYRTFFMTNMTSLNIGLSAALCLGIFSLKSFGEDSQATLYFDHFVEIDHAKESQFKAAIAKQTKAFAPGKSTGTWGTHKIITGLRAGQYVRWFGPLRWNALDQKTNDAYTYTPEFDTFIRWPNEVRPFLNKVTTVVYDAELDSYYEGLDSSAMPLYFMVESRKIKPGMKLAKTEMDAKLAKVYEAAEIKANIINSRILTGGDTLTYVTSFMFNSMAEYKKTQQDNSFRDHYEKIHGAGSWKKHLTTYRAIIQEAPVESELWQYIPELSSEEESVQSE